VVLPTAAVRRGSDPFSGCSDSLTANFGSRASYRHCAVWPTTRRIRENASDQSVRDELDLDDQVSGDQLQQLDRRLAPALPYVKSLFVGWFEPLRDAIARDQDVQRRKRVEHIYAKYLLLLPADKMAVILMHKMMGLLMSSKDGSGSVRVVQAAHCIGEAVEREVSRLLLPCLRF
jgi:DNA-directed RNA polymerase